MKKILYCLIALVFLFSFSMVCYAGDIPECLLADEEAQVYFGEVKSVNGEKITVIQKQHIKGGKFVEDNEITYTDFCFTEAPLAGEVYLCGYLDENNPLYIWEVSARDTSRLKITNQDDMSKRMEQYLNEGEFEEAEAERVAQLEKRAELDATAEEQKAAEQQVTAVGSTGGTGDAASGGADKGAASSVVSGSVIGGSDGPTAIFLAGKVDTRWNWINIFGLILVVLMLVPNIIFAMSFRDSQNQCTNRAMNVLEQVGRYGSMFFMVVNVFGEYGFSSLGALLVYMLGNGVLLLAYWIVWMLYFVKQQAWKGMALAILPTLIFLISGIALGYVLLVITAVIFAVAHIYVTWQNVKGDVQ